MPRKATPDTKHRSFTPVKYRLLTEAEVGDLPFGEACGSRISYYGEALTQLLKGRQKVLVFEDVKCRGQLIARSKKLGVKLLFAEFGGKLYCKLASDDGPAQIILGMLRETPRTIREILAELSARSLQGIDPKAELQKLSDGGLARLGTDSRWIYTGGKV